MGKRKWYEWLLTFVYIAMILVFLYLNLFSGHKEGLANIIINGVMFLIVGIVFLNCELHSFAPVNRMIADLKRVTQKIRKDAMNTHVYLWERYKNDNSDLFEESILKEVYRDYVFEMDRIENSDKAYYKTDIENYISPDLIDRTIHRNLLNQVAGAMTGLGILGTFIGLSLGLQSFSTGTTAEISNSIEPLMQGIRVAFHTSIYGMVFSLVFNYVFKRKLDDADDAVEDFIGAYKKYVLPDTTTDGINRLMEFQKQQTEATQSLALTVAHQLSQGLAQLLEPQFDRFDKTISDFGRMATKNQMEQLSIVVDAFIEEMNHSLNGAFSQLAFTINQTYQTQQENAKQMQEILRRTGSTAEYLKEINTCTAALLDTMNNYAANVQTIEAAMSQNVETVREESHTSHLLLTQQQRYLKDLSDYRSNLEASAAVISEELRHQDDLLRELSKATQLMPRKIDETFEIIDETLISVENHFQDTIEEIKDATEQVPEIVRNSYAGIEDGFARAAEAVQALSKALDKMERRERERSERSERRPE